MKNPFSAKLKKRLALLGTVLATGGVILSRRKKVVEPPIKTADEHKPDLFI